MSCLPRRSRVAVPGSRRPGAARRSRASWYSECHVRGWPGAPPAREHGSVSVQEDRRGAEVGAFLRALRARLRPEDVGLADLGRRRTPGLRRQEVAERAAVSIEWYIRLEQGKAGAPGSAVLDGIAEALLMSPAEREYLHLTARG